MNRFGFRPRLLYLLSVLGFQCISRITESARLYTWLQHIWTSLLRSIPQSARWYPLRRLGSTSSLVCLTSPLSVYWAFDFPLRHRRELATRCECRGSCSIFLEMLEYHRCIDWTFNSTGEVLDMYPFHSICPIYNSVYSVFIVDGIVSVRIHTYIILLLPLSLTLTQSSPASTLSLFLLTTGTTRRCKSGNSSHFFIILFKKWRQSSELNNSRAWAPQVMIDLTGLDYDPRVAYQIFWSWGHLC